MSDLKLDEFVMIEYLAHPRLEFWADPDEAYLERKRADALEEFVASEAH